MKRKPDPLAVLAVVVVVGMLSSSFFSGTKKQQIEMEQKANVAAAQNNSR